MSGSGGDNSVIVVSLLSQYNVDVCPTYSFEWKRPLFYFLIKIAVNFKPQGSLKEKTKITSMNILYEMNSMRFVDTNI